MSVKDTAASLRGKFDAAERKFDEELRLNNSLANMAVGLLTVIVTLLVSVLVGGEFADAIPADNAFGNATETITDNAETAFVIFGVGLLVIPAVGILFLVRRMGGAGNGGMGR
jgi:hypothetical protein